MQNQTDQAIRHIQSRTNPEVKKIYLLRLAKNRKMHKFFIAEGLRTCKTLIEGNTSLQSLYITPEHKKDFSHIAPELICTVSQPVMDKISQAHTPSGILGVFEIPESNTSQLREKSNGLVLTRISNPGNMGTLIRTAAAMDANQIIVIEGADPWSFKSVQSSAGYIGHVKIFQSQWNSFIEESEKKKLNTVALVVRNGENIHTVEKTSNFLVVGNEAEGIPQTWIDVCTKIATLPMPGKTESLNAAVAGSIALYVMFS